MDHLRSLFVCLVAILTGFGVLMVHSASITSRPTEFEQVYLIRHLVFLVIGIVAALVASRMSGRFWQKLAPWLLFLNLALLVLVLVPGIGTKVKGAQRWLRYGPVSIQPSELTKLLTPLCVAAFWSQFARFRNNRLFAPVIYGFPAVLAAGLIFIEPDLGTAAFVLMSIALTLFLAGLPFSSFLLWGLLTVPLLAFLKPYQWKRITGFLDGWSDSSAMPYQLEQSLSTLGSGGWFGSGLGAGWQKLSFLPEANTDFVFAVAGEELGIVGTISIVLLWAGIYYLGLLQIRQVRAGSFESIAATTLLTQLVAQAALNIAVVTALVPPKGITHPLISYGGNSLVVSLMTIGVILGLTRQRPMGTKFAHNGASSPDGYGSDPAPDL